MLLLPLLASSVLLHRPVEPLLPRESTLRSGSMSVETNKPAEVVVLVVVDRPERSTILRETSSARRSPTAASLSLAHTGGGDVVEGEVVGGDDGEDSAALGDSTRPHPPKLHFMQHCTTQVSCNCSLTTLPATQPHPHFDKSLLFLRLPVLDQYMYMCNVHV